MAPASDAPNFEPSPAVLQPERLRALRETGLLDTPARKEFDRLGSLLRRMLGVRTALVTLVDADRQVFLGQRGLKEPWASVRETPLSHSFCQHVVADGGALRVEDARRDPRFRSNRAVEELGVVAYLGVPLRDPAGNVLGAVCAIDGAPRTWTKDDVRALDVVAVLATSEIALREALHRAETAAAELQALNGTLSARVAERTAEVERLARALTVAEEEERARLARVLHDDFQQWIYGARLQLGAGPLTADVCERIAALLEKASDVARSLSHDLAPVVPEGADLREALHALAWYGEDVCGLDVSVGEAPALPLPGRPLQLLVGRVGKELLFNVAKHAGVRAARLSGRATPGGLEIEVRDEGVGFSGDARSAGIGLSGVRERVRLFGGAVAVASAPGRGTAVVLSLPLPDPV